MKSQRIKTIYRISAVAILLMAMLSVSTIPVRADVNTTYVDDDWAGTTPGEDPDGAGPAQAFGTDAFATIQEAIDATADDGTVNVAAGTYSERIVIDSPMTVRGATYAASKYGYTVPASYAWDDTVESIINEPTPTLSGNTVDIIDTRNVTFEGFVVQNLNASGNDQDSLLRVTASSSATSPIENIIVQNNVIGPFTNTTSQDGTHGRMGLYIAMPNYSNQGLLNSSFNDNLIFDTQGNGNNVFVWGAAEDYHTNGNTDMTGTVIDYNDIYGSHRSGIEIAGGVDHLTISNNHIHDNSSTNGGSTDPALKYGNGIAIIRMGSDRTSTTAYGPSDLNLTGNLIENNEKHGVYTGPMITDSQFVNNEITSNGLDGLHIDLDELYYGGSATPVYDSTSGVEVHYNELSGNTGSGAAVNGTPTNDFMINATCNWWSDLSGPTSTDNTGGLGEEVGATTIFAPWLIYADDDAGTLGFQPPAAFTVTAGGEVSEADNDFRRLGNALTCVLSDQTVTLSGTFDWSQPLAQASWAIGADGDDTATDDNYWIMGPQNTDNVTITADSLGDGTIQGPGDLATLSLEGFFGIYWGSTSSNQNWTISNLEIFDFDLSLGFFFGGGTTQYNGLTLDNNHLRMPADLNATDYPNDNIQNIGIHLAFGQNQTITNNTIDVAGDGVSNSGEDVFAASVVLQSNTSGGTTYDGLQITNNTVNVLNAQSADPEMIIGLWENAHGHSSNITVSNNTFNNLDAGNDPALNLQQAFRLSSHSSTTTTVTYENNLVDGANLAYRWYDSAGGDPIIFHNNTATNCGTGLRLGGNANADVDNFTFTGVSGYGQGIESQATSQAVLTNSDFDTAGYGANVAGDLTIKGSEFANMDTVFTMDGGALTAYANNITDFTAGIDAVSGTAEARHNWWGAHDTNPGGVSADAWDYRLGAPVVTWADGDTSAPVTLADSVAGGDASISMEAGVGGTMVIVNHGPTVAPFGKYLTTPVTCSDYYDFFVISGHGTDSFSITLPINANCPDPTTSPYPGLLRFNLTNNKPDPTTCSGMDCWNLIQESSSTSSDITITGQLALDHLGGTPFAVPYDGPIYIRIMPIVFK
jgi:hypothetical protein